MSRNSDCFDTLQENSHGALRRVFCQRRVFFKSVRIVRGVVSPRTVAPKARSSPTLKGNITFTLGGSRLSTCATQEGAWRSLPSLPGARHHHQRCAAAGWSVPCRVPCGRCRPRAHLALDVPKVTGRADWGARQGVSVRRGGQHARQILGRGSRALGSAPCAVVPSRMTRQSVVCRSAAVRTLTCSIPAPNVGSR
jgi:hypothetical protein